MTVTTYSVNRRAELTVSDDGPGIPRRAQSRIFERFYTADSAGGSGLGLAIARELAQRMQGRVAIASSKRFTAFTLDLPRSRAEVAEPAERRPAPGQLPHERDASPAWTARYTAALVAALALAGCGSGGEDDTTSQVTTSAARRRRRSSCRQPSMASTRPRSTARPRRASSRSARSSPAAPPRAPASCSTPRGASSPTPTSSPRSERRPTARQGRLHRVPRPQHRPR